MALLIYDYIDDPKKLENYNKEHHVGLLLKAEKFTKIINLFGDDPEIMGRLRKEHDEGYKVDVKIDHDIFSDRTVISMVLPNSNRVNLIGSALGIDYKDRGAKMMEAIKRADIDNKMSKLILANDVYDISIPHYILALMKEHGYKLTKTLEAVQQKYRELTSHDITKKINKGEKTVDTHVTDLKKIMELIDQLDKVNQ